MSAATKMEDFASLLEESFAKNDLAEGYVAKGIITAIEKDVAIIDVGLKVEGRVPLKEFGAKARDGSLKVGDEVEVFIERIENALGEAVLSREKARREESWGRLEQKFEAGERVEGVIFNQVKGGFTVDLDGAVAFLPRSQVDIRPIRDVTPLMHNPQPFEILKMDKRRGNIVVSRRTVLEESRAEQRSEIVQNLEEGQVVEGVVKNITDYGAFVDLGGIDGLLHVTDMAWRRVNHPSEILNIGQSVKVQIIRINQETHRISLGIKQLGKDNVGEAASSGDLRKNSVVSCEVTAVNDGGIEVKLVNHEELTSFIRRADLSRDRDEQRPERFQVGQVVDARVINFSKKDRKVQLSIKALEIAEEKEAVAQFGSSDSGASLGDILGAALKNRDQN